MIDLYNMTWTAIEENHFVHCASAAFQNLALLLAILSVHNVWISLVVGSDRVSRMFRREHNSKTDKLGMRSLRWPSQRHYLCFDS